MQPDDRAMEEAVAQPATTFDIGGWCFDSTTGVLTGDHEIHRLEFRTARTLALLCRHRGAIVGHDQILREIWGNRSVSANSVAVVIRDIRKALGDDARNPVYLETVAKRGYRLADQRDDAAPLTMPEAAGSPSSFRLRWAAAAILAIVAACVAVAAMIGWRSAPVTVMIEAVHNETGDPRLAPTASALTALATRQLSRVGELEVVDAAAARGEKSPRFHVHSRLILWDGRPTWSIELIDQRSGKVGWTGMVEGPPFHGPAVRKLDALASTLVAH